MRTTARPSPSDVPARPLFSEAPDPPGVYHSIAQIRNRWVFYALGMEACLLGCERPKWHETDAEVVARLEALIVDEPRVPALALVNTDTLIAHGLDPSLHRPLSLPRLIR